MSALISCRDLEKSYASRTLFQQLSLSLSEGERLGIIGPNGAGKTTLLRVLLGEVEADTGSIHRRKGLRTAWVPQDPRFDDSLRVEEIVLAAADAAGNAVERAVEGEVRARIVMDRMAFPDVKKPFGALSGGWKKRVAIAAALAGNPDLLFLDEPTNHLDLDGLLHLEEVLASGPFSFVLISHDRVFLDRTVSRMVEISPVYPDGFFTAEGNYSDFLLKREAYLKARTQYREGLANRVRRELEWLGRGAKARTTKARSRIEKAEALQQELRSLDETGSGGRPEIEMGSSGRRSRRLLVARGISKKFGEEAPLFSGLDLLLRPGQCLGVVGANGSGKSTLLKILAGELEADEGEVRRVEGLRTVYFDQKREKLDAEKSLRRCLSEHSDTVIYRERPIHIVTWAKRFQFRVDQLDLPLSELSGGERARVHIARLMLRPADLLILDEPTNDLDIPTLEVLEESLRDFPGALVLVSHDRLMMDRVAGILLGLDGSGSATFYADVEQWESGRRSGREQKRRNKAPARRKKTRKPGLSYLEKREYDGLEAAIAEAEAELARLAALLDDPSVASDAARVQEAFEAHRLAEAALEKLLERWVELEEKLEAGGI